MIRRLLLATVTVTALAVAACGGGSSSGSGSGSSGSSSSGSGSGSTSSSGQTATFTLTEFKITTDSNSLKSGSYTFNVQNKGQIQHDLHIATPDGSEIAKTPVIQPGGSATLQVNLSGAGTYTIWCQVDAHRAQGMQGTLTVT